LAFLQLNFNELDKFTSPWWEILEIQYYSEGYGSAEWARLKYKNKIQNAPIIDDSAFIELLHRGGMLIYFAHFFDPTPIYVREAPCYGFYATSLMKKRNLFHACQQPWVLERRHQDKMAKSEKFCASLAKYNKAN